LIATCGALASAPASAGPAPHVPPLHGLSNYEYRHAGVYIQLVTTHSGRGIYTLQISTRCNLSDGNQFVVQTEQVGGEVEPIDPRTGKFFIHDEFPPDSREQIEGLATGQELSKDKIAFSFSVRRLDTQCNVARYPRGASRGRYGLELSYTGHFQ